MQRPKALLEVEGVPLVIRVIESFREAGAEPLVVLGAHREKIESVLGDCEFVVNDRWAEGMGTSIACGVRTLRERASLVCIAAVDQPKITSTHFAKLFAQAETPGLAATRHPHGPGIPAAFGPLHFDALCELDGDRGARAILASHNPWLVDVDDPTDVDTPQAWKEFLKG